MSRCWTVGGQYWGMHLFCQRKAEKAPKSPGFGAFSFVFPKKVGSPKNVPPHAMEQRGYAVAQPMKANVRQAAFPDHPPEVHGDRFGRQRSSVWAYAYISAVTSPLYHIWVSVKSAIFEENRSAEANQCCGSKGLCSYARHRRISRKQ